VMTCLTCHQPHAGNENGMLVKDQAPSMAFCRSCHTDPFELKNVGGDKIGGKN